MKPIKFSALIFCFGLMSFALHAQHGDINSYTKQDTLRGSITPERVWWDLQHYELSVTVDPSTKSISGSNKIQYIPLSKSTRMQIDLQEPLVITSVSQDGEVLEVEHVGNAHFITLKKEQPIGQLLEIEVVYEGVPREAKRAPWDGGFSWSKDANGKDFIATSCQGLGASVWWPNKDHMYDEPDKGMVMHFNVPKDLVAVGNGRLVKSKRGKKRTRTYTWKVVNPINNYGVNLNIGDYVNFKEVYPGEMGNLDMDYWVLKDNLEKAKEQFKDAPRTMEALEYWFGPYPFYEDSYKLVEVPYLGMEHQSSVTYGNQYKKGYLGRDTSGTGWGLNFDFIIIHESGHEWFANNITYKDMADMWIHESFTNYSESLFLEYFLGKEAAYEYMRGNRSGIRNRRPIIADYNVNARSDGDMYPKGANMLHTIRQMVKDDETWRSMLRGLNKEFYHQTVTTEQVESYMEQALGLNLKAIFNQYLRDIRIPIFEYRLQKQKDGKASLSYRWTNTVEGFAMPLKVVIDGQEQTLEFNASGRTNSIALERMPTAFKVDSNAYVATQNLMGN